MGRSPCCDKVGLKKGPWTPEEDTKLLAYIDEHGHGSWRALPAKAGLQRCGKSCRLRWTNYLRPDIKRGKFSLHEEQTIIQLHALLGNRWSAIATHLPKRTDNEIKNYWNTHLKKRLAKMGIDPVTHKPKSDTIISADGQSKSIANLSHMAQWESARLEAEARLVRESKLRAPSSSSHLPDTVLVLPQLHEKSAPNITMSPSLGSLWSKTTCGGSQRQIDLQSPTSTLSFSESMMQPSINVNGLVDRNSSPTLELKCFGKPIRILSKDHLPDTTGFSMDTNTTTLLFGTAEDNTSWIDPEPSSIRMQGSSGGDFDTNGTGLFTEMLLDNSDADHQNSSAKGDDDSDNAEGGSCLEEEEDDDDESNSYWENILDLVTSSPPANSPPPAESF